VSLLNKRIQNSYWPQTFEQ